ncbi:benenodin family lasso peptide [Rhodanobacter denitrificans]|nr:benenodin family lasso peptide [Rhodanobacter denitrificans]
MNTNENMRNDMPEDVIELGTASVETKGSGVTIDEPQGHTGGGGISQ